MAKYNVHAGHNSIVPGAGKYLDEVEEDRKVKNSVISLLKSAGNTVYDCTDDKGKTQGANLANIVAKCNAHSVDLDISIHLNAGGGTGVEVYYYTGDSTGQAKAAAVSAAISEALGIRNRGAKATTGLYVLSNTKATAILIECCFVDNKTDQAAWDVTKCAQAIVKGVTGKTVSAPSKPSGSTSKPAAKPATKKNLGNVDIFYAVNAGGKNYPEVKNKLDWAGKADGVALKYLGLRVSKGSIKGRVYTRASGWLPWITFTNGYNLNDHANGCLGDGSDILAVQLYYITPAGYVYKKVYYRVSVLGNDNFYSAQIDDETGSGMDGYAGDKKNAADKLQAWVA